MAEVAASRTPLPGGALPAGSPAAHSTVTLFARFRDLWCALAWLRDAIRTFTSVNTVPPVQEASLASAMTSP